MNPFQPLQGLEIISDSIISAAGHQEFRFLLYNRSANAVYTDHTSSPVLGVMQNKSEIAYVPLILSTEKHVIMPGGYAKISLILNKDLFSEMTPLFFYTRSKENIRGETLVVK